MQWPGFLAHRSGFFASDGGVAHSAESDLEQTEATMTEQTPQMPKHYFVDESGDGTLFDRKGRVIAGVEGCSSHFALGVLDVSDPIGLEQRLNQLRVRILGDPYFSGVASVKPEARKTSICFHAKDDIPEIRRMVFELLAGESIRFHAVIRDKRGLAVDVANKNRQSASYRYHPNALYDQMVTRLFKNLLHKDAAYRVNFARRGAKDRTHALQVALERARENLRKQWGIESSAPIEVASVNSSESAGLQAVDYFLWALQRVYSKGEDRFLKSVWEKIAVVHDVDDRRKTSKGVYYTQDRPLTSECVKKMPGI